MSIATANLFECPKGWQRREENGWGDVGGDDFPLVAVAPSTMEKTIRVAEREPEFFAAWFDFIGQGRPGGIAAGKMIEVPDSDSVGKLSPLHISFGGVCKGPAEIESTAAGPQADR